MTYARFDRRRLRLAPLEARTHRISVDGIMIDPDAVSASPPEVGEAASTIVELAARIRTARTHGASVMLTFGAHALRNGLGPMMLRLAEAGWITHFATNGGGSIHDWELAFIGHSCEDVRANMAAGQFGLWEETGRTIGLALAAGAAADRGYGESIGGLIADGRIVVPEPAELRARMNSAAPESAASAADLLAVMNDLDISAGVHPFEHPHAATSVQGGSFRQGVPFTVHPGIGYDIVHEHPAASGGAYGRTAYRDFLTFAQSVTGLSGGVYISMGSAIMSPMVLEKSLAMAQNVALQDGAAISGHTICVNDLAPPGWDWRDGEPTDDGSAYYQRNSKSFYRMGGEVMRATLDNRAFFGRLYAELA